MPPFSLMTVGVNVLVRSWGLLSSSVTVRCSCVTPTLKHFSTAAAPPPKRPLTAYMRYVKEQQPILYKQSPGARIVDITRKVAQQWKTLTPEEKRPFEEASVADREQYKVEIKAYQAQLTPAQTAGLAEERKRKIVKRKSIRKKRELTNLGKPKRSRTAFNIFMSEHYAEAKGSSAQSKLKSMVDDWNNLSESQNQIYKQLAEDDKVRYKNEMTAWEEHMTELGREDLVRQKVSGRKKAPPKNKKKKSRVKVLKAKATGEKPAKKKTASSATGDPASAKMKQTSSAKKK